MKVDIMVLPAIDKLVRKAYELIVHTPFFIKVLASHLKAYAYI